MLSPHFVAGENVEDPAQILIGLTAMGAGTAAMQADWRDGTLAEFALVPAATVTPAEGLDAVPAAQLAVLKRAIVPYGGLLRGRLTAGETLLVNGATGAYGIAAVLLGLALGAARVVAAGRNAAALDALANAAGPRVVPVRLSSDLQADVDSLPRRGRRWRRDCSSTWSDRLRTRMPPWPPCTACAAAAGWF